MQHPPDHSGNTSGPASLNPACNSIAGMTILSPGTRRLLTLALGCLVLLILAVACWIPFGYESSSILYQFGLDRTLLRAGKMVGLSAAVLLLLQIASASRLHWLDRILGLNNLYAGHRVLAILALALAAAHPLLVLGPNGIFSLKPTMEFWPEWLGVLLVITLAATVILAIWREKLRLPFHLWWLGHRLVTPVLVVLLGIHTFSVSDTFASGPPRTLLILALALFGLAWARLRILSLLPAGAPFTVTGVNPVSRDAVRVELAPARGTHFPFAPGQFSFATFASPALSREEHPFTIASSPLEQDRLELIIKKCGDWTEGVDKLQKGSKAGIQGPFGLFSICAHPEAESFVFIAGGVGITPFLSMLRTMARAGDPRSATLLWSNKTHADVFLAEELQEIAQQLEHGRVEVVITRETPLEGQPQRLDRQGLEDLLPDWGPATHFFICGPQAMMDAVRGHIMDMGVGKARIHMERFKL